MSGEVIFSGANGDRKRSFFPFQLNTSRIGNLTMFDMSASYQ